MNQFQRILSLSKKIALGVLNEKEIHSKIRDEFSEDDTKDIVENLTNHYLKKRRDEQLVYLNEYKHLDWEKVKPNNFKRKIFIRKAYRFVAILAVLLTCGYFYFQNTSFAESQLIVQPKIATLPYTDVILNEASGETSIISNDYNQSLEPLVETKNGFKLDYTKNKKNIFSNDLVYNEITVPYGRNFQVVLHDGSKVTLNSGSSLKYPTYFLKNKNREVFLTGEAFFEVQEDKTSPFIVNANDISVTVLGTKFNVSNYPEDLNITTVLLEGSIALRTTNKLEEKKSIVLQPGKRAVYSKNNKEINIGDVIKTTIYTSWMEGRNVFEHMPFDNIVKKLERHYNVSIINNNKLLGKEIFTASFDVETIEQVLASFKHSFNFNHTIEHNKITIN